MFDIKKEVPSLKLCKKLKKLGYSQKGEEGYWWLKFSNVDWYVDIGIDKGWLKEYKGQFIKAPSSRELGELLPDGYETLKTKGKYSILKWKYADVPIYPQIGEETEANARAKMIIWLVEKGYINIKGDKI